MDDCNGNCANCGNVECPFYDDWLDYEEEQLKEQTERNRYD